MVDLFADFDDAEPTPEIYCRACKFSGKPCHDYVTKSCGTNADGSHQHYQCLRCPYTWSTYREEKPHGG